MTVQDDVNANPENPLRLRAGKNGGGPMLFEDMDQNLLNVNRTRFATWSASAVPYAKNELVYHRGILWVATTTNSLEPSSVTVGSGEWLPLTLIGGRGSMTLATPPVSRADLGAGWDPITEFDSEPVTAIGITVDPVPGTFVFNYPGLWKIELLISLAHDSSNQGRTTGVRLFDVTTGAPVGSGLTVGIGRNVEQTQISAPVWANVSEAVLGDVFRFEIGGGSAISAVEYDALAANFQQIGY